jgi:hypothetical protein
MEFHQPNREAILLSLVPERKTPEDLNPELDNLGWKHHTWNLLATKAKSRRSHSALITPS